MSRLFRFPNGRHALWAAPLVLALTLTLFANASAPPQEVDQEADEAAYRTAVARRSLEQNCLICHTDEMIVSQRLTPAQWKAEVEKMVGWGAPLPKEDQPLLIDYLAARYSDQTAAVTPARMTYEEALARVKPEHQGAPPAGDPSQGARLYATNCASCHGPDAQGADLGDNLVERPVLLRPGDFHEVVRKGRRRMPGFQAVLNPAQAADILAWLRQRTYNMSLPK
jgi:ubiquinol-cytochrome c reductase cytochrome c subunit